MARPTPSTRLPVSSLRWSCQTGCLEADDTRAIPPVEGTVGQARALKALKLGLELKGPGFNVFVSGPAGTGRTTTVKRLLDDLAASGPVPSDRVCVHNFACPESPRILALPQGRAAALARAMEELCQDLRRRLPRLLEDRDFNQRRRETVERYAEKERTLLSDLQERLQAAGFGLVQVQAGPVQRPAVVYMVQGEPASPEMVAKAMESGVLEEAAGREALERFPGFREQLAEVLGKVARLGRRLSRELDGLFRESALLLFEGQLADLRSAFEGEPAVLDFLAAVERDLKEETVLLPVREDGEEGEPGKDRLERALIRYTVNVLVDRSGLRGSPVVLERFPTHSNLFGTVERLSLSPDSWTADHRHVLAGSLLRADGGFLVLSARDLLSEDGVWELLKRVLKNGILEIQAPPSLSPFAPGMLKPEPAPIDLKVVLIGEPGLYGTLHSLDPEFRKIFKVKAEFDAAMPLNPENLRHFQAVLARICEDEELRPLDRSALAACAEFAVRAAGGRGRISTRFNEVADLVREASFWAGQEYSERVSGRHVDRARRERDERHGLLAGHIQRLMEEDALMIDTAGRAVGQVNGLSVYQMGYHSFGKPTRITAAASAGGAGIINVEREARLSGGIYDKGVLIIAGWMRRTFAGRRPLSLTASLCFEQSYAGVDGDSASVAELCALLSDLARLPLDQSLAVTGSINQHGEIQPVGGVNEKIEGFFDLCAARGLTGGQGCVIPGRNVADLMLRPDLVDACAAGRFAVHAVNRVEEALELLSGLPAGAAGPDGTFPPGTFLAAVAERLAAFAPAHETSAGLSAPLLAAGPPASAPIPLDPPEEEALQARNTRPTGSENRGRARAD